MSETSAPACYRERTNGVYFTKGEHRPNCDDDCRGCRPCTADHCSAKPNCTWHVEAEQLTCGRCLAATRRDLRWIAALAALLPVAAMGEGVNSEAANLAGPSVDPVEWSKRKTTARRNLDPATAALLDTLREAQADDKRRRSPETAALSRKVGMARTPDWHVSLIEDDDEHHPARVVGTWAMMLTEDYGHPMPQAATLTWTTAYLDRTLHRIAQDDEQDFPLLGRELRKCRQHLESVLHNDDRPDRGVPCPTCTAEEGTGVGPRLRREWAHWCEDEDCERIHDASVEADVWRCPRDHDHWWTHHDYENRIEERRAAG